MPLLFIDGAIYFRYERDVATYGPYV